MDMDISIMDIIEEKKKWFEDVNYSCYERQECWLRTHGEKESMGLWKQEIPEADPADAILPLMTKWMYTCFYGYYTNNNGMDI